MKNYFWNMLPQDTCEVFILYGLGVMTASCAIKKQNWFETNKFVPTGF